MVEIKIGSQMYSLLFNLQVLDDINQKYGSLDGFRRALTPSQDDTGEGNLSLITDFAWIIAAMANQAIISQNFDIEYGMCSGEKRRLLSLEYVLAKLTPSDLSNGNTLQAVTAAINDGMSAEIPESKNQKVDLVRENIEAKKD